MKTKTNILLSTISFSFALVACGGDSQTAQPPVMASATPPVPTAEATPPAATTSEPQATPPPKPPLADLAKANIMTMMAAFNAHDAKKLASVYTTDAVASSPAPEGWKSENGRDAVEQSHVKLFAGVPDVQMRATRVLMKGDQAAIEWVSTGTDKMGEKPSGKSVGFRAASVVWFDGDGMIKQEHVYIDYATIAMQTGKMPGKARAVATLPTGETQWLVASASDDALADKAKGMWPVSWAKHDRKAYDASITDDFLHEEIASPNDYKGRKEALKEFDLFDKAIPDQAVSIENAWAAGGVVVMEFTFSGTQKGALGPLKATNKKFTIHGLDFATMNGDKMSKATTYSNSIEYLTQLGFIPSKDAGKDAAKGGAKDPKDKPKGK